MSSLLPIQTKEAPKPGGHYSQGVAWRDLVFVSGQLPIQTDGTICHDHPFEAQARLALQNALAVALAAGATASDVLKVTAYLSDVEHWPAFNAVFAEVFGSWRPARTVVPVPGLHFGVAVEVDLIAAAAPQQGG